MSNSTTLKEAVRLLNRHFIFLMCVFVVSSKLNAQCNTFGNFPPAYTNSGVQFSGNNIHLVKYTLTQTGYLTGLGYQGNGTGTGIQMGIYTDVAGVAGTLIASSPLSNVGSGNIVLPVTPVLLPAGDYWIGAVYQANGLNQGFVSSTAGITNAYLVHPFGAPLPVSPTWLTGPGYGYNYWATVATHTISASSKTICVGSTVTLTAVPVNPTTALNYTWSTTQQSPSITVTPSATANYTASAMNGTCMSTSTIQITVNLNPNVTISNSSPTLCSNPSSALIAFGALNYTWQPVPGTGATLVASPMVQTSYSVTGISATGCTGSAVTTVYIGTVPSLSVSGSPTGTICAGTSVALAASGAVSYSWFPSTGPITGSNATFAPSSTTVYTLTGSNGVCDNSISFTVPVSPGPVMTVSSTAATLCPGQTATLSVTGTAVSHTWQPLNLTTPSIQVSPGVTTTYTLISTDAGGCTSSTVIQQAVAPLPIINISPANPSLCAGNSQTITATGGASYTWAPGNILSNSLVVSPSSNTSYTVSAHTSVGCPGQASVTVNVIAVPVVTTNVSSFTSCPGTNIFLQASGATSYVWQPGNLSGPIVLVNPTSSVVYTVTGSTSGCGSSATISGTVHSGPSVTLTATPTVICSGATSTLAVSGGINYTWSPGSSNSTTIAVSPSATTIYTVSAANAFCTTDHTLSLSVNPLPTVSVTAPSSTLCAGSSMTLGASGAVSYTWLPGSSTGSVLSVSPTVTTVYTVTGMSSSGCTKDNTITVTVPSVTMSSSSSFTTCSGTSVTLTATGGLSYTWTNSSNTVVNSNTNQVTVPFANSNVTYTVSSKVGSCTLTTVKTLTVSAAPFISGFTSSGSTCPGNPIGLNVCCAAFYLWSPGNYTTSSVVVSPSVTTVYTAAISNGTCSASVTIPVTVVTPTMTIASSASTVCAGQNVTLTANGAVIYSWDSGATGSVVVVTPTATTTYSAWGVTSIACVVDTSILINVLPSSTLSALASPSMLCSGGCATLSASGGSVYSWQPLGINGSSVVACPSVTTIYTVSSGCNTGTVTLLSQSSSLSVLSFPTSSVCAGSQVSFTASGSSTYTWNPGGLTGSVINVFPTATTVYTVTANNSIGCVSTQTVGMIVVPKPTLTLSPSPTITVCSGNSFTATVSGANTYTWSFGNQVGNTFSLFQNLSSSYQVTGTGNLPGCNGQAILQVNAIPLPTVSVSASTYTICKGATSSLNATGATNYTWMPGSMTGTSIAVSPTATTIYTVTGETSGCNSNTTVMITVNNLPTVSVVANSSVICNGSSSSLTASGASSYTWNPGGLTGSLVVVSPSVNSVYTVTALNSVGCSDTQTVGVGVVQAPTVNVSPATVTTNCQFNASSFTLSGASSYTWIHSGTFTSGFIAVTPSITTTYTITGIGSLPGCNGQATILVNVIPLPTVTISAPTTSVCKGGSLNLSASGASTYTWMPVNINSSSIIVTPIASYIYSVTGTSSGCSKTETVQLTVVNLPTITLSPSTTSVCSGGGVIIGASGAASYTWNPTGFTTASISTIPSVTTVYTVSGTSTVGCVSSETVSIVVNPSPVITTSASTQSVCPGQSVSLVVSGASSYTWNPGAITGSNVVVSPSVTQVYTVNGAGGGCSSNTTISIVTYSLPVIGVTSTPTSVCKGSSVSLNASGANTYTWLPLQVTGNSATDTPTSSIVYTVVGVDVNSCINSGTYNLVVIPIPTVMVSVTHSALCIGSSATLSASGASQFTWQPQSLVNSSVVVSPTVTTTYSVHGNVGNCLGSATVSVSVNPLPAIPTVAVSGSITCASPTVNLFSGTTSSNVSYSWTGPGTFTSSVQNPGAVNVWGNFTVNVSDLTTQCSSSNTISVFTDQSIPSVTASVSGSLTCAVLSVALNCTHSTTNAAYFWQGPQNYTSSLQNPVVTISGNYSVTVTDLTSGCTGLDSISVKGNTVLTIHASISAATCSAGLSLNNGTIKIFNIQSSDRFDLVKSNTYTGNATYANAIGIATTGIITDSLHNPLVTTAYTLRLFTQDGCVKDTTLFIEPNDCSVKTLGIAKSVSSPQWKSDRWYHVSYWIIVRNNDTTEFNSIQLKDDLKKSFPSPVTFVLTSPVKKSQGSNLELDPTYDGNTNVNLLIPSLSVLAREKTDTLTLDLKIRTGLFYIPFYNSVTGEAINGIGATVRDSSQSGLEPDPDQNQDPTDNNEPTPVSFSPAISFGISQKGDFVKIQNNTYDVTYTVTLHNLGNDTLRNITLVDTLAGVSVPSPASYVMRSVPEASGSLSANTLYNGNADINLLQTDKDNKLAPGAKENVRFIINLRADTLSVLKNRSYGRAFCITAGDTIMAEDISNSGDEPDTDSDGVCNEDPDNTITFINLPVSLFIPQAFSPNGDNINDRFVIKGLPKEGENNLSIFNRWGTKVYHHADYAHADGWDGSANTSGTLGQGRLPRGTYYFILEMNGSGLKPVTGFIELQY